MYGHCLLQPSDQRVGDIVTWIAATYSHDSSSILVMNGEHVLNLHSAIADLPSVFVIVYLCDLLDRPGLEWSKEKQCILDNLKKQRNDVAQHQQHEADINVHIQRGGVRRHRDMAQDPRSSMINWAQQRLSDHTPEFVSPVSKLIIKAEARCATALMHSRSPAQTRQIMVAAYKRHGLSLPDAAQPSVTPQISQESMLQHMSDIYAATTQQTVTSNHILETIAQHPTSYDMASLAGFVHHNTSAQMEAIQSLRQDMQRLYTRISLWEDRHAPTPPASPTSARHLQPPPAHEADTLMPQHQADPIIIDAEDGEETRENLQPGGEGQVTQQLMTAPTTPPQISVIPSEDQEEMETADYGTQTDLDQRVRELEPMPENESAPQFNAQLEPRVPSVLDMLRTRSEHSRRALQPFRAS